MKYLFYVPAAVIFAIISMILSGYAVHCLWSWFVTPVFNLPPLTTFQAAGILTILQILKGYKHNKDSVEQTAQVFVSAGCSGLLYSLLILLVGYCIHVLQ
jgi:hypothetical protein